MNIELSIIIIITHSSSKVQVTCKVLDLLSRSLRTTTNQSSHFNLLLHKGILKSNLVHKKLAFSKENVILFYFLYILFQIYFTKQDI